MSDKEPRPLCFADTETTGVIPPWLPGGRRIWEIGLIRRELDGTETARRVFIRAADVDTTGVPADHLRDAKDVGQYDKRYPEAAGLPLDEVVSARTAAEIVRDFTCDAHLVGAVIGFDAESFTHLLHWQGLWQGVNPPWNYHKVDVEPVIGGLLGVPPYQWHLGDLARSLGINPEGYDAHQALEDARLARDVFDATYARHGIDGFGFFAPVAGPSGTPARS